MSLKPPYRVGRKLRVVVNGQEIQDLDLDRIARMEKVMPGVKRAAGRVGLQQHSGEVRFRAIEIRKLNKAATEPEKGNKPASPGK